MKVRDGEIAGVKIIELNVQRDHRGHFIERFHSEKFKELGLPWRFVQDNLARSLPRVLRGLHFQQNPGQGKLISTVRGRTWHVGLDIRQNSPTFGKYFVLELSDKNSLLLWIPGGFAHGYCVLGNEHAELFYKVDAFYDSEKEGGIRWSDSDLNIPWPTPDPLVSERDSNLLSFAEFRLRNVAI